MVDTEDVQGKDSRSLCSADGHTLATACTRFVQLGDYEGFNE